MDDAIRQTLGRGGPIDITTTGRKTGLPRRIEIVFFNFGGRIYISGMPSPRRRSWLANLVADPAFTVHLRGPVGGDLPATAREIADPTERRTILTQVARAWRRTDVDRMVAQSPLIEVTFPDVPAP